MRKVQNRRYISLLRFTKTVINIIMITALVCLFLKSSLSVSAESQEKIPARSEIARPSADGFLYADGPTLVNRKGEKKILQGISTHGLTWYPDYINLSLFTQLSKEWDVNLIRLPMYSEDYLVRKEENLDILHRGIQAAIDADMYVMADWHILNDNNPKDHMEEAKDFFDQLSREYADTPNLIYEICNEPNGDTTWDDVYEYANVIIPVIRANSPNAVIIVGTPDYDQDLKNPAAKPLSDKNTMYSFHFYTGSHYEDMQKTLSNAVDEGLPVFISECGICHADGDGENDYENAKVWFSYLKDHYISFVVWNLSNKKETSSFIKASSGAKEKLTDEDLTDTGIWIRSLLMGEDPKSILPGSALQEYSFFEKLAICLYSLKWEDWKSVRNWPYIAGGCLVFLSLALLSFSLFRKKNGDQIHSYDDLMKYSEMKSELKRVENYPAMIKNRILIFSLFFFSINYLIWRILYSINNKAGWFPVFCNLLLFFAEVIGFFESTVHYSNLFQKKDHPCPKIENEEYPEVDIFIATYNEPEVLLKKTINGCKHLEYPDPAKVHIWVCDDNRRSSMRALAEQMGVGYFDRPDNKGAKAGNLNNAMKQTSAPYVVTLDADMIVKSDFLLKTIPYFVHTEKVCAALPEHKQKHLGLLQTPQCFYDPDIYQFALYSEKNIPNEQDFFYRTIEVGKTSTNSVIYGGSNTVLFRKALEDAGGFNTDSITEDYATGMLIEAAGYLSLAIEEPLASGSAPCTFREHIKQRTRWGRGVVNASKHLHLFTRKDLSFTQKLSYLSSVAYWYSPFMNLVYVLSPLIFAVFMVPVFRCCWLELLVFWLPMFLLQEACLRIIGKNTISLKWTNIHNMSLMPFLLRPVFEETVGITMSTFLVTDKTKNIKPGKESNLPLMLPFILLTLLSVLGIIRILLMADLRNIFGMVIILFWLIRNLYSIVMTLFLIDGRDTDENMETVVVKAAEMATISTIKENPVRYEGVTTRMTEHNLSVFLDDSDLVNTGDLVHIRIETERYNAEMNGVIIGMRYIRHTDQCLCSIEIIDYEKDEDEYLQILYDRTPTLPQSLHRDFGLVSLLWRNIVYRIARTL